MNFPDMENLSLNPRGIQVLDVDFLNLAVDFAAIFRHGVATLRLFHALTVRHRFRVQN